MTGKVDAAGAGGALRARDGGDPGRARPTPASMRGGSPGASMLPAALAWGLAVLVLALEVVAPDWSLGRVSRLGIALVPFLALAGVPTGAHAGQASAAAASLREVARTLGLALPVLALGLALDVASGRASSDAARSAGIGLAIVVLWSAMRGRAATSTRAARVHAVVWLVLVPGVAAAHAALVWAPLGSPGVGMTSEAPAWSAASPLVWAFEWTRASASPDAARPADWVALCCSLVAWLATALAASAPGASSGNGAGRRATDERGGRA